MRSLSSPLLITAWLAGAGCSSVASPVPAGPVQAFVYFHADPLVRKGEVACQDRRLVSCGTPDGEAFLQRVDALAWLAESMPDGVAAHLELGPDAALAWAGDEGLLGALSQGEVPRSSVEEGSALARESVRTWVERGFTLGLHSHGQTADGFGNWGSADPEPGGPDACASTASAPMNELDPGLLEEVLHQAAVAGDTLLQVIDAEETRFDTVTGAVPRWLFNKRLAVEAPDDIDVSVSRTFPVSYAPLTSGPAESECFYRVADHAPFTVYPQDDWLALGSGSGPAVLPGVPSLGHLDERFDSFTDSTVPAARRRMIQLLVNWRYTALAGGADRPWVFSWGDHDFDLLEGMPGSHDPLARDSLPEQGSHFREELLGLVVWVQDLSVRTGWHGVEAPDGLVRWEAPRNIAGQGDESTPFSYLDEQGEPLEEWDPSRYPYLALVAEELAHSHLVCESTMGEVGFYGFQVCPGGWDWAVTATGGYTCAGGGDPSWVYLLLSASNVCLPLTSTMEPLLAAPVDGARLEPPVGCQGGVDVPTRGLLLRTVSGSPLTPAGCP